MTTPSDSSTSPTDEPERQDLKTLKKRYEELNKKKIRAETERASSERRLAELQRKARARYGTDDLEALRAKLDEMRAENERRRSAYQAHLDAIEAQLDEVEAAHEAARAEGEGEA